MIDLSTFLQITPDLACVVDSEGHFSWINPAFERALGYCLSDLRALSLIRLAHRDDQAAVREVLKNLAEGCPADSVRGASAEGNSAKGSSAKGNHSLLQTAASALVTHRYRDPRGEWRYLEWTFLTADEAASMADLGAGDEPALGAVSPGSLSSGSQSSQVSQAPCATLVAPPRPQTSPRIYGIARDITIRHLETRATEQRTQILEAKAAELESVQARYDQLLVSERKAHQHAALSKAEAKRYAEAVQHMPVGLLIWRLADIEDVHSFELVAMNPAASLCLGIPAEEALNKPMFEAFPTMADTDLPHTYAEVIRTGRSCHLDTLVYGDSRVKARIFDVRAFPLAGNCVGIAFEDVTSREQMETLRKEQAAQLKVLFEQAGVGMARLAPDGQWIQVNDSLCHMLGYSTAELLQKTFTEVSHPEDAEADQALYQQLLQGECDRGTLEKRYLTKAGKVIWAHITVSAMRDDKGQLLYFIATIENITARKEATLTLKQQKEDLLTVNMVLTNALGTLEQRNQELDQFAYVTSHDLKAPLRAIANLAGWIEEDIGDSLPPENKEQFALLKGRVQRMEGLINGLLEYSRVGRAYQSHEQVDVAALLDQVMDSLSPPSGFTIEIATDMPVLEAKKVPLAQVFSNLIDNAIKHHDRRRGHISVSAKELEDYYEFVVADDGPGIEPVYHEKVFTIFQTLQPRDELESTGIGLAIVQKVVKAEGGNIAIESNVGEGVTIRFTWPKAPHRGINLV